MARSARSLLIRGGRVIQDARDGREPAVADLLIRDGRIAAIIDGADAGAPDRGADLVIDGRNKLIIPGLVNAHYHSHDVLARGMFEDLPLEVWIALAIPAGRKASRREVRLRTLLGAAECLRSGITTLQDMLGTGPGGEADVEIVKDAYAEIGIRTVLGLQVGNRSALACLPGLRHELPAALHGLLDPPQSSSAAILGFIEAALRAPTQRRLTWAIAPGAPQRCSLDLLEGLAALSRSYDLPVVTHVNETKLQVLLARELEPRHQGSWLSYLAAAGLLNSRLSIAHGVWLDDREIDLIAAAGAGVVTNPTSNLKLKSGVAPLRKLHSAGVVLGVGCDNVSAGDAQNLFQAMKLVCSMSAAKDAEASRVTAQHAFEYATTGGARLLRLEAEIGTIEVGKAADLTLLDATDPAYVPLTNPVRQIVYSECGRGVDTVLVDGEIVVEKGRIKTIDWDALCAEAAEIAEPYRKDLEAHAERLSAVVPYIFALVKRAGEAPLAFNRWIASDDAP
jgi:cytosine/adenosine deaminase-related metal-dependent hydrolase